jgi:hypothetical protein
VIVRPFSSADAERWDDLVARAPMATFLHTRRFLEYHRDRFEDASLIVDDERGALCAVLPAAVGADPTTVVSHPGATFGGLVHGGLYAEDVLGALRAAAAHHAERGRTRLRYRPVPHIYQRAPSGDDVWALAALGAERTGCALACAIDLAERREPASRRARSLRKALGAGVTVTEDAAPAELWPVLEEALQRRHGERPVHTLGEIELLAGRFPGAIRTATATLDGETVAGVVLFVSARVAHVQYMAASQRGMAISALDPVLERCIELADADGARYFDFGTSMLARGSELQSGLHRYKAEFGGGGVVYETYDLALDGEPE